MAWNSYYNCKPRSPRLTTYVCSLSIVCPCITSGLGGISRQQSQSYFEFVIRLIHYKKSRLFRLVLVTVFQSQATSTTKSCVVVLDKLQTSLVVGDNMVEWKLFSIQIPVHDKIRVYVCGANIQQLFWLLFSTNAKRPCGILDI